MYVDVHDLPILVFSMSAKGKPQWRLNELVFLDHLQTAQLGGQSLTIAIEYGWARPGEGVSSAFHAGRMLGAIGAIAALMTDTTIIRVFPQAWKKHMGLIGKDKDASRLLAQQWFPDAPLKRKKDHGRSEALLIAKYALETGG